MQSTVEAPYLYLLARSGSSTKDQIMYVRTRLEDIKGLEQPISFQGKDYTDRMRFFSGDSPARALEAGHQCNGKSILLIKNRLMPVQIKYITISTLRNSTVYMFHLLDSNKNFRQHSQHTQTHKTTNHCGMPENVSVP